jgi:hypothetical protein
MLRKCLLSSFLILSALYICKGQVFIKTTDLFPVTTNRPGSGTLNIIQDPAIDTLLSRYILSKKNQTKPNGFRILIYRSSELSARNESERIHAEFMTLYPNVTSYRVFQEPNYFIVLAGNFRAKTDGLKLLFLINRKYPDAIFVPYVLDFDDLNKTDSKK